MRILDVAQSEATEAALWYEAAQRGLGVEFISTIETALNLLESDAVPLQQVPNLPPRLGVKRLVPRRFPYDVVVVQRDGEFTVIAFAHHARRPGVWRERLSAPRDGR